MKKLFLSFALTVLIVVIFINNSNSKSFERINVICEIEESCNKKFATLYLYDEDEIDKKKAIMLFLPGGEGNYNKLPPFFNYLLKDLGIAILNPGYNMPNPNGDPPLRYSSDYQEKIRSSILLLKKRYNKQVWLNGHSAGGPGIAGFLKKNLKSEDYLAGVIYSGANSKSWSGDNKKNLPILIIHHKDDRCQSNSYDGAKSKLKKYSKINSSVTKLVTIEGGGPFKFNPCSGQDNRHSFTGKEKEYAESVLQFIKENTK